MPNPSYNHQSSRLRLLLLKEELGYQSKVGREVLGLLARVAREGSARKAGLFPSERYQLEVRLESVLDRVDRIRLDIEKQRRLIANENRDRTAYVEGVARKNERSKWRSPRVRKAVYDSLRGHAVFPVVATRDSVQQLAIRFLFGHVPWLYELAKWADKRKLKVVFQDAERPFTLKPDGSPAPIIFQVLFAIVASERIRRRTPLARERSGSVSAELPTGSRGVAVVQLSDVVKSVDGKLSGRPSLFAPYEVDLSILEERLGAIAPLVGADELVAVAPVLPAVLMNQAELPQCLRLVAVTHERRAVGDFLGIVAEILGVGR